MLKSEARSGARIEYLSKVAKQEPQYEPPPSTSRTRSTHTSCAPSTRRSKTSLGGAPTYMKSKEKAGARWRSMLSEDELDHYASQLDVILASVARVAEVAAADVPATSHPIPMTNVLRPDVVTPGLTSAEALSGAPASDEGRFRVPRILDEE